MVRAWEKPVALYRLFSLYVPGALWLTGWMGEIWNILGVSCEPYFFA